MRDVVGVYTYHPAYYMQFQIPYSVIFGDATGVSEAIWFGSAEDLGVASKWVRKCIHRLIVCKAYASMHSVLTLGESGACLQ